MLVTTEPLNNKIKLLELETRFKEIERRVEENRRNIDTAISKYGIRA